MEGQRRVPSDSPGKPVENQPVSPDRVAGQGSTTPRRADSPAPVPKPQGSTSPNGTRRAAPAPPRLASITESWETVGYWDYDPIDAQLLPYGLMLHD